jgi:RNA polymerase sigma factor (sigma-70 family)
MESDVLRTAVRRLREVVLPPKTPDADLVGAVAARRDPAAFELIVRRHGPLVLGVCRRILRDPADADDAFQATFLVFLRKAGGLRHPDRLPGWLHQVAHRTARKLRALRVARGRREIELFDLPAGEVPAEVVWRELRPIFDAELDRLPDRLRLPAVLCLLEGQSKAEAARSLGWPEGTVAGRLQRARERLRARLVARGLTLSAGAFAAALLEGAGSAGVPDRVIASTIQSITTPATAVAARALADGVTQAMFLSKVKALAAAVLVVGVVGTGTGVILVPGTGPGVSVAGEPAKEGSVKDRAPRPETPAVTAQDPPPRSESDFLKEELLILKERLAWEEKTVATGFVSEAQARKTRLEVARAEAALAKAASPPVPDPRRAAMEEIIQKVEQIVRQTEEGVKKGIVPQQELHNAQLKLLEYKFKLIEITGPPADPRASAPAAPPPVRLEADIDHKKAELDRAEALAKQKVISQEEVRRLRIDLARLRAGAATAAGDFGGALKQREAVVAELDAQATAVRELVERKVASQSALPAIGVALAEARVEALRAGVRRQLAEIVAVREAEVKKTRVLHEAKAISAEELRQAERALAEAKARLAAER